MKRLLPYILVILLSLPTVISLMRPGYFPMHDDLQAVRVFGMTECFKEFQIPCRWVADMGYGYGYPQFNYYGPLPYYLMSLINLLGVGIFDSVKIGFALSLVLGNLTMFALAKKIFGSTASALLSAFVYAYVPYRASDLYSRGAMGESWAFVFMPLILLGIKRLVEKPNVKSLALTGVFWGLLMATHNVTTLIFTPFALLWGVLLFIQKEGDLVKKIFASVKWLSLSVLWGSALSAFFMIPVVFEKQFAHTESMIGGYFDYRAHFISFKQLFFTSFWGYGSSEIGPTDDLSFFFSPILLLLVVLTLLIVIRRFFQKRLKLSSQIMLLLVFGLFAAFMAHEKSSFVWSLASPLIYLQFPWRFLVLANFFFALAIGYSLKGVQKNIANWILVAITIVLFVFSVSFFRPLRWLNLSEQEKFSGNFFDRQMTISIFDYLPTSANTPPNAPAPVLPTSSVKESSVTNYISTATHLSFDFETMKDATLRLNRLYFPGWEVRVNGKRSDVSYGSDGIMFLSLAPGKFNIEAGLKDTPVRMLSNTISFIAIISTVVVLKRKTHE